MERRTEILRMTGRTEVIPLRRIMLVAAAAIFVAGCSTAQPPDQVALAPVEAPLVGPRGYQGPAGPAGPQGSVGATGAPGYVMAGPAGAEGPTGPMGAQGPAGPMGASGAVVPGAYHFVFNPQVITALNGSRTTGGLSFWCRRTAAVFPMRTFSSAAAIENRTSKVRDAESATGETSRNSR